MTDQMFVQIAAVYTFVSLVTCVGLLIRWVESREGERTIWPIAGMAWPALVLIGVWKAWEDRHD